MPNSASRRVVDGRGSSMSGDRETGRLSSATTTSAMPTALTTGAVARAPRPSNRCGGAQRGQRGGQQRPTVTATSEAAVHSGRGATIAMASRTAAPAWQATAPIVSGRRAAQGRRRDGAQGAGAAEHDRGVAAVDEHQRADVVGGVHRRRRSGRAAPR